MPRVGFSVLGIFMPTALLRCLLMLGALAAPTWAHAFTATITPGTRGIYLQVGNGTFSGTMIGGGTPGNNTTVNRVSVSVAAAAVGNGVDQSMPGNQSSGTSFYDGYAFCNVPAEIYIGGFFRKPGSGGTAVLSSSSPVSLTNPGGDVIPFTQISWTSSGNGDTGAQPIPSGTFNGGSQTLASFPANTWNESCHSFKYANDAVVASGTYVGRVTYTLSAP